jgi:hypothetical protein
MAQKSLEMVLQLLYPTSLRTFSAPLLLLDRILNDSNNFKKQRNETSIFVERSSSAYLGLFE